MKLLIATRTWIDGDTGDFGSPISARAGAQSRTAHSAWEHGRHILTWNEAIWQPPSRFPGTDANPCSAVADPDGPAMAASSAPNGCS